ncbi:MAG: zinc ribbon domain-containing protein [Actinomycetota bacterium]
MDNEAEKTCANCGKPLKEGAAFCTGCGAAVDASAAAAAATPPGPAEPAPPVEGAPPVPPVPPAAGVEGAVVQPAYAAGPAPKKNKAALIVGICGGVLVAAGIVVLVLWLAVWRDGSGGGTGDPLALAQKYMDSLEQGDIDAYMACFQEDFFIEEMQNNPFLEELGLTEEDVREFTQMAFEMMEVRFEDVELEVSSQQGDEATVVTTAGTASMTVFGMEEEVDLADDPLEFNMVKDGGRWYLTENPMGTTMGSDMDFDMDDFEDMDLEDFEDLDMEDLEDFNLEDFNLEDLEQYLPEGMDLEELMDMSPEELEQMLEELEQLMQDLPQPEESGSSA